MDTDAILAASRASVAGEASFPEVVQRLLAAGVEFYHVDYMRMRTAFLQGRRVTYLGRAGDAHTEWFPGAGPSGT